MLDLILIIFLIFGFVGVGFIIIQKNQQYNAQKQEILGIKNDQNTMQNGTNDTQQPQQPNPIPLSPITFITAPIQPIKTAVKIYTNIKDGNIKDAAKSGVDAIIDNTPIGIIGNTVKIIPDNKITTPIKNTVNTVVKNLNPFSWW